MESHTKYEGLEKHCQRHNGPESCQCFSCSTACMDERDNNEVSKTSFSVYQLPMMKLETLDCLLREKFGAQSC